MGIEEFKRQVEQHLQRVIAPPVPHIPFTKNIDDFSGWVQGDDGLYSHTIFIENGGCFLKVLTVLVRPSRGQARFASQKGPP